MDVLIKNVVFIVGVGAPANLYADYFDDLKKRLPHITLFVLEWWKEDDFGINTLKSYINNSDVILIGHSAGSVLALQALVNWPCLVKKIIMLDSHFLRARNSLPTVSHMLDIILSKSNPTIKNKVENAYAPLLKNDLAFNSALTFAIEWVNDNFDRVCHIVAKMQEHSALHIGFTNSVYQILDAEDEKALLALWGKFGVDVKCFPMTHFDLINNKHAAIINQFIASWLHY